MRIRKVLATLFCVSWMALILFRVDLLQAYGKGTGKNRMGFSPFDVLSYSAIHTARLRGSDNIARYALACIGIPGEVYKQVVEEQSLKPMELWESSLKWTRDNKMKPVMQVSKDPLSGLAAAGCILSVLIAVKFPKEASLLFSAGLVGLQAALRVSEPSVKLTEDMGIYSVVLAAVSMILH